MDLFFEEHPDATSPLLWRKPRYTVYGQGQVWREPFDQCFWCSSLRPLSINILCWVDSLNRYPTSVPLRMLHLVYSASTCQMRSAVFLPSSQPQMLGQVILFWVLISCLLVFMPHLLFSSLSRSIPGGLSLSKRPWLQRELRNQTSVKRKSPWSDSKPHLGVCLWLRCCISERRTTPDETFHQRRRPHHRRHWLRVSYGQTGCIGCSLSDSLWWNRWPRFVDKKGQFSSFWMASPVNAKRLRHILYPSSRKPYYTGRLVTTGIRCSIRLHFHSIFPKPNLSFRFSKRRILNITVLWKPANFVAWQSNGCWMADWMSAYESPAGQFTWVKYSWPIILSQIWPFCIYSRYWVA